MIQERLEEYRRQKRKKAIRDWLAFRWNRVETEEFATKSAMDEKVRLCRVIHRLRISSALRESQKQISFQDLESILNSPVDILII